MREAIGQEVAFGYHLGDPISLEDFLALPSPGQRLARDDEGRLVPMSPDDPRTHRIPLGRLVRLLGRELSSEWEVLPEPPVHLPSIYALTGELLPESRLGPKCVEPDVGVFEGEPRLIEPSREGGVPVIAGERLRLAIELLSTDTWRGDLGRGSAPKVDHWRSYLASGVPEYWILNLGVEGLPLPPRSALFLENGGDAWVPLSVDDRRPAEGDVRGLRPVAGGRVTSRAVPELALDLDALWPRLLPR